MNLNWPDYLRVTEYNTIQIRSTTYVNWNGATEWTYDEALALSEYLPGFIEKARRNTMEVRELTAFLKLHDNDDHEDLAYNLIKAGYRK